MKDDTMKTMTPSTPGQIDGCLKLISTGNVVIGPTNGTEIISTAHNVFDYINHDFKNWGCDVVEWESTPETPVCVYEQIENSSYRKTFCGFGQNLNRLCLTTPQIKKFFAAEADNWLREDGWAVYHFLFKVGNKFFVARAFRHEDGYKDGYKEVRVDPFSKDIVWYAEYRYRFVLPQL